MKIKLLVLLVCALISLLCVSTAKQSSEYQRQLALSEQERQKQLKLSEQERQRQLKISEQERQKQLKMSELEHQKQLELSEQERQKQLKMSEQERQKQLTLSEQTAAWFKTQSEQTAAWFNAWSEKWVGRFSNLIMPRTTVRKWNEMLMEADMQNPPIIDPAWASNNEKKALSLQDQLTQLHSKRGDPWGKISPEHIDEYRKLVNKAQEL